MQIARRSIEERDYIDGFKLCELPVLPIARSLKGQKGEKLAQQLNLMLPARVMPCSGEAWARRLCRAVDGPGYGGISTILNGARDPLATL
jgi:hypothetical protein